MTELRRTPFAVEVRRSARARRSRITIEEDGRVVVVLPRRASLASADLIVERHRAWVERHRGRALRTRTLLAARPAIDAGRMIMVDGAEVMVRALPSDGLRVRGSITRSPGRLVVHLGSDGRSAAILLEAWLRREARMALHASVAARARDLDVTPGRMTIRDQRTRWGSASAKGDLSFNWRLVLAPPWVLDAVVVHELVHLRTRGHGPAFRRLVLRHAPRTLDARRWLRDEGAVLRRALD